MPYTVDLLPPARRGLGRLPRAVQEPILHLTALQDDPYRAGTMALHGEERAFRLRVGDYRIVYRVEDDSASVVVERIGHRREVYRR